MVTSINIDNVALFIDVLDGQAHLISSKTDRQKETLFGRLIGRLKVLVKIAKCFQLLKSFHSFFHSLDPTLFKLAVSKPNVLISFLSSFAAFELIR